MATIEQKLAKLAEMGAEWIALKDDVVSTLLTLQESQRSEYRTPQKEKTQKILSAIYDADRSFFYKIENWPTELHPSKVVRLCNKMAKQAQLSGSSINKFRCDEPSDCSSRDAIHFVACPLCKTAKGFYCATPSGRKMIEPHAARMQAYLNQGK